MISYLEGKYSHKSPAMIIIDVHGVGYEVNISLNTYSDVQSHTEGRLYTYLQVKEDSHTLFGFSELKEKQIFVLLISVSGVGAATARMMLSSMRPEEVERAILQGNARLLESVKGIGRKTAERLVLELRDKVHKQSPDLNISSVQSNSVEYDALDALVALGIAKPVAEQSIKKIIQGSPGTIGLEELVKKALKAI